MVIKFERQYQGNYQIISMKQDARILSRTFRLVIMSVLLLYVGVSFLSALSDMDSYGDVQEREQTTAKDSIGSEDDSEQLHFTFVDVLPSNGIFILMLVFLSAIKSLQFISLFFTFRYLVSPRGPPSF